VLQHELLHMRPWLEGDGRRLSRQPHVSDGSPENAGLENDGLENDLFLRHTMYWKAITPIFDDGFKLVTPISSPFLPTFKILQRTICRICVVFETA